MSVKDITHEIETHQTATGMTIWFLGGPSVAIQTRKTLVYLDLFTGPSPIEELHKATVDVVTPANMRAVDAVLSTHHDLDHCHKDSLKPIYDNSESLFIGPSSCHRLYREWGFIPERTIELKAHEGFQIHDLRIWAMPCNDYFDADAVSYILQSDGVTLFDGGDTLYYAGYRDIATQFDIDVALLNFAKNPPGEIYYMNQAHVARTAEELGARILIPKHYDLWKEFLDDPNQLLSLLDKANIEVRILSQGDRINVTPRKMDHS